MSDTITTDDMARMRAQGALRAYLRTVSGPSAGPTPPPDATISGNKPATHISGAWPVGASDDPARRVCACHSCKALALPEPEQENR